MDCDNQSPVDSASCLTCLDIKPLLAIKTFLLAQIASDSSSIQSLVASAIGLTYLSEKQLNAIQAYQMCQLLP